jgi:hypothetical protein
VLVAFLYRNARLEKLESLPEETTLFEEDGIPVEQRGTPRMAYYGKCRIRLTNKRLIIAQKMLFSQTNYVLRFVITFNSNVPAPDLSRSLKSGYYITSISRNSIVFNPDNKGFTELSIPVSKRWTLHFSTKAGSDYKKFLKEK